MNLHVSKSQGGFALIEALVSVAIFSFALIGLVGMQSTAVASSTESKYRSDASYLASQIIGQVWSDRGKHRQLQPSGHRRTVHAGWRRVHQPGSDRVARRRLGDVARRDERRAVAVGRRGQHADRDDLLEEGAGHDLSPARHRDAGQLGAHVTRTHRLKGQRGFTLVELMVGLVVGLIASAAIIQTFSTFEAQKRSTVAGSEAQENGLVALSQLEQDIHNAGAGVVDPITLDCTNASTFTYSVAAGGAIPNFTLAPVVITPGGTAAASDTVQVTTGDFLGGMPAYTTKPMDDSKDDLLVSRTDGFATGDLIIVAQGGQCSVMQVSAVTPAVVTLSHDKSYGNYNPPNSVINAWPAYATGAHVLNPEDDDQHAVCRERQQPADDDVDDRDAHRRCRPSRWCATSCS